MWKMYLDEILTEDDHVVPDQLMLDLYKAPNQAFHHQEISKVNADDSSSEAVESAIWEAIEEVISLGSFAGGTKLNETKARTTELHESAPKRPERLNFKAKQETPDFDLLIGTETPEAQSDARRVPLLRQNGGVVEELSTTKSSITNFQSVLDSSPYSSDSPRTGQTSGGTCRLKQQTDNSRFPMDSIMHIRNSLNMDPFDIYGCGMEFVEDPDIFMQGGTSGMVLEERIKYACAYLDIPMEPSSWTVDQVRKWARFVLKPYDSVLSDSDCLLGLSIDGATLTTMTKEDLINYFPVVGETLYNELEVWCFGLTSSFTSTFVPQNPEQSYIELDTLTKGTYHDLTMTSSVTQSDTSRLMTSSGAASPQCESVQLPPLCSMMPGHMIKQESDMFNTHFYKQECAQDLDPMVMQGRRIADISPLSSPDSGVFGSFGSLSYSPSSTSSGHSSTDMFDEDLARRMAPSRNHVGKHTIQLWQFLKELLLQPQYESYIRWLDRGNGVFKIEDSASVAKLWGRRKNRPAMNYDKLSRSIRQYYKKGIIKKTSQSKRLVYQFCPQYNG